MGTAPIFLKGRSGPTMWNTIIGIVFVIGGLSGKLVLRGTNSSPALVAVGDILIVWGLLQMKRRGNG